jgi:TM2 domain-containing membrane protein YozV
MYSTGIAYLLWFLSFFGVAGLHRFYLGKIPTGLLWLFTGGLAGFGAFYDFFTLPGQVREANYRKALENQFFSDYTGTEQERRYTPHHRGGWRTVDDGDVRIVNDPEHAEKFTGAQNRTGQRRSQAGFSPEKIILRLAKHNKGILTPGELALEADISIDQAKRELEALVAKGFAEIRVRRSGVLVYTIPEFMDTDSPLEDF